MASDPKCATCGDTGLVPSEVFVPEAAAWAPESKPCPDCPDLALVERAAGLLPNPAREVFRLYAECPMCGAAPAPGSASPPARTLAERVADPAFAAEVRIHGRYLGPLTSAQDWSRRWKAAAKRWRWEVVKPRKGGCVCEDGVIRVTGRAKGLDCPFCREKRRAASAEAERDEARRAASDAVSRANERAADANRIIEASRQAWEAAEARAEAAEREVDEWRGRATVAEAAIDEFRAEKCAAEYLRGTEELKRRAAESALSALREGVAKLAADAERQSKLNPPELGDPIAVVGPWAWSRLGELLRALLGGGDAKKENGR